METQLPSPKRGRSPKFFTHICCGQMAGWIKMPLGRDIGLRTSDIVLDGDPAPPPQRRGRAPQFSAHIWCGQMAGWIKMPHPKQHCVRWGPSSPSPNRGQSPQFLAHVHCSQMAGWIKMPLGREVGLSPGHIVLDGDPAPPPSKGAEPHNFWPMSIVAKWRDGWRFDLVRK